jgi:hypothetical protein
VNQFNILPTGSNAAPIWSAKTTVRWDLSESVAAIAELYFTRDRNRYSFRDDISGIAEPTQDKPNSLGFNTLIQARF